VAASTAFPRAGRLAGPIACGCGLAAAAVYVGLHDPATGAIGVPCPLRTVTGWWCPGCGLTRATHRLLRGDVAGALRFNLFVVVVLAAILVSWVSWLAHAAGRSIPGPELGARTRRWLIGTTIAAAAAFAVARNLPGVDGLRG
jgi:hypothetical protein